MSRESDLNRLWLKWVESELSQVRKFVIWVESELSQSRKVKCWVESELSHLDCQMSQSRVSLKIWVEHNHGLPPNNVQPGLSFQQSWYITYPMAMVSVQWFSRSTLNAIPWNVLTQHVTTPAHLYFFSGDKRGGRRRLPLLLVPCYTLCVRWCGDGEINKQPRNAQQRVLGATEVSNSFAKNVQRISFVSG